MGSQSTLRLRGTFIAVDAEGDEDMYMRGSRRRARTESPVRSPLDLDASCDIFDDQRKYVAGLSEKLTTLWAATTSQEASHNLLHHTMSAPAESPLAERFEQQANHVASALHLRATLVAVSEDRKAVELAPSPVDTEVDSSELDRSELMGPTRSLEEGFALLGNEGSVGHPYVCSRMCLKFVHGTCIHGIDCEFCHMDHKRRPVHLDRQQREVLHAMPKDKAIKLLLPLLKEKMLAFDSSADGLAAFDEMLTSCGIDSKMIGSPPAHVPRTHRKLMSMCHAMSFRTLLQTLRRSTFVGEAAEAKVLEFVVHLRSKFRTAAIGNQAASVTLAGCEA